MPAAFSSAYLTPILLLIGSNVFMTLAWYGHLRFKETPLVMVIFVAWGIAFIEYCMAVPANRFGSAVYTTAQLKTIQEVITLLVFAGFSAALSEGADHLELRDRLCADRRRRLLRVSRTALSCADAHCGDCYCALSPCGRGREKSASAFGWVRGPLRKTSYEETPHPIALVVSFLSPLPVEVGCFRLRPRLNAELG